MKISILLMQFDLKSFSYSSVYFIDILAIDLLSTVSRIKPLCCMYFCGVEKIQSVNQKISIMFTMIKSSRRKHVSSGFMTCRWENNDSKKNDTIRTDFLKIYDALYWNQYFLCWRKIDLDFDRCANLKKPFVTSSSSLVNTTFNFWNSNFLYLWIDIK